MWTPLQPGLRIVPVILHAILLLIVLFLFKRGRWSLWQRLSQDHKTPVGS